MPRHARLILPDVALHLVQRGNNRSPCFFAENDRSHYLFHLRRFADRFGCRLHAYCLMTNHVHLLLTPQRSNSCAQLMKHVGQLHTQYINKSYDRSGTLWEGRFHSCLVQSEHHVLSCYRYIELNPVRAGIVADPGEFPWSSFRANALGKTDPLLSPHPEYLELGKTGNERREVYRDLFGTAIASNEIEEIRQATRGGFALGAKTFRNEIAARLGRRVERGNPGRPRASGDEQQGDLLDAL